MTQARHAIFKILWFYSFGSVKEEFYGMRPILFFAGWGNWGSKKTIVSPPAQQVESNGGAKKQPPAVNVKHDEFRFSEIGEPVDSSNPRVRKAKFIDIT